MFPEGGSKEGGSREDLGYVKSAFRVEKENAMQKKLAMNQVFP